MKYGVVLLVLLGTSGCMRFSKDVCPKPYTFSVEEQHRAAEEVERLPENSALLDMFLKENRNNDYLKGLK